MNVGVEEAGAAEDPAPNVNDGVEVDFEVSF